MRGHITERAPNTWRIWVSGGSDATGKRRQVTRTVKGTRRDAERMLTKMLADKDANRLAGGQQPLGAFLRDEWLPDVSKMSKRGRPLAPTTRARYADAVAHVDRVIGNVKVGDLTARHVKRLRDSLLGHGLAEQTVSGIMRVLAQALNYAEAEDYIGRNPASAQLVSRPVGKQRDFVVIDPTLAVRILQTVEGTDPWDAAVHLGLGLGLRREEVLALRWSDIRGRQVDIERALTAANGELHIGPPKSDAGKRSIPLPPFVADALARHRDMQRARLDDLGIGTPLVVDAGIGQPWFPPSFSTGWRRFAEAHNLDGITFHGQRHGAASLLLAAGVADKVALEVMGHADTRILRHYQDVAEELKRDAAGRMQVMLGGRSV